MNTTSNTINDTVTADKPAARTQHRFARRVLAAMAGIVLATGGLVVGSGAQPVAAFTVGGCGDMCDIYNPPRYYTQPGTSVVAVDCTSGLLRINPIANVLAGTSGGQYISYRYYVSNNTGYSAYSGWSASTWVPRYNDNVDYKLKALPGSSWRVATGLQWTVQVQFAYYTSSGWTYSYFQQPTGGYSRGGSTFTWANCYT